GVRSPPRREPALLAARVRAVPRPRSREPVADPARPAAPDGALGAGARTKAAPARIRHRRARAARTRGGRARRRRPARLPSQLAMAGERHRHPGRRGERHIAAAAAKTAADDDLARPLAARRGGTAWVTR